MSGDGPTPVHVHRIVDEVENKPMRLSIGETEHPDTVHWFNEDPDTAYCGKDISDQAFTEEKPDEITCGACYFAWLDTVPIEFD